MTQPTALYARVSTDRQEHEKTIDSQLAALRSIAEAQGFSVVEDQIYRDEGYSGARLDRPGLDALRDAAGDGRVSTLMVFDPDRLARNFVHQQVLLEELERRNVRVVFAQRPLTDRPEDRLLAQMQGVFAEYERTKILERTRRGRLYKARLGLFLGWSTAPFGYRLLPGPKGSAPHVIVEEGEARWVRSMFQWVVEEGLSIRQVARRLNERGVAPRKAAFWSCSTVRTMMVNPVYTGTACYNRSESIEPKRRRSRDRYPRRPKSFHRRRPSEEWIRIPVPALVSLETQARALAEFRKHRWTFGRRPRYPYLLRRRVTCGECGLRMNATLQLPRRGPHPRGGREFYLYYTCKGTHTSPEDTGRAQRCRAKRVRADRLDEVVWASLSEFLQKPEVLRRELAAHLEDRRSSAERGSREAIHLTERRCQIERQRQRLVDAYQAGALEVPELRLRSERIEAERAEIDRQLGELRALGEQTARREEVYREVDRFCSEVREGLDRLAFEEKVKLIQLLVDRVVTKNGEVTIEHVIPLTGRFVGKCTDERIDLQGAQVELRARQVPDDEGRGGGGADLVGAPDPGGESSTAQPGARPSATRASAPVPPDPLG